MWKQAQYLQMKEHSVLSLQKYPFTRRSDEEEKDQGAWTRSPILSVCLRPPKTCLAPAAAGEMTAVYWDFTVVSSVYCDLAVCSCRVTVLSCCKARLDSTQWRQSFRGWRALRVTVFPFHDTTRTLKWNTFSYYIFCLVISSDSIKWKGF